jgi:phosphoglycolate phosphatase-like HAD superfamily hydrolase
MNKLLLFDIDGTLVSGTHDNRFERAIGNIHGLDTKLTGDFQGYTDYLILATLLQNEGWDEEQIESAMPELLKELDIVHKNTFRLDAVKLLPGVKGLLAALSDADCTLGLITGNVDTIAERKLKAVGIWSYFKLGGYGNDLHTTRADLVTTAVKRAGYEDRLDEVYVIGDTARDIAAAHDAGIKNSVGVANGFRSTKELIDAKSRIVLKDFKDTSEVLKRLGIGSKPAN